MKATRPIGFLLFCILLSGVIANAQLSPRLQQLRNTEFDNITRPQGLPSGNVSDILQDKRGYMWFATRSGLCRYSGQTMTVYMPDYADTNSISSSDVLSLFEDTDGTIWVGTTGRGLNVFHPTTGAFTHGTPGLDNHSGAEEFVVSMFRDRAGVLWIGSLAGLTSVVEEPGNQRQSIHYRHDSNDPGSLSDNYVRAITEDPWDASRHSSGMYFYRLQSGDFVDVKELILLK